MQKAQIQTAVFDIRAAIEKRAQMSPEERDAEDRKEMERLKQERTREMTSKAHLDYVTALAADVGKVYQGRALPDLMVNSENEPHLEAARDWLISADDNIAAGRGFWIIGPPGCGKTAILSAMLYSLPLHANLWRKAKQRRLTAKYVNWARFICDAKLSRHDETLKLEQAMRHCDVLVMDDVGAEQDNQTSRALAYNVVDYRAANELPVFVSSNLTVNEMEEAVGKRVVDRLVGMVPPRYRRMMSGRSFRRFPEQIELK